MATVIKKRKRNQDYYYVVQSGRVNGQPRVVWQRYLGPVARLLKLADQAAPPEPREAVLWEVGGVAALLRIAQRLGVVETIDRLAPKREQGPSVGQYLLLAALNRALAPTSKAQIGEWYETTLLRKLWGHPAEAFTSQRFWDHMDRLDEPTLIAIETEITRRALAEFQVNPAVLLYDATNFFTFIDTFNDRCDIAQRGHSKAKRHDLRQVGLALLVARDFRIPLLHRTYEGNRNDVTQFGQLTTALIDAYRELSAQGHEITLVFDKGNLSADNLLELAANQVHVVASLTPSHYPEFLAVPLEQYAALPGGRWAGVRAHRAAAPLFGAERSIVLVFSETFFAQQYASLLTQLNKAVGKLHDLAQRLLQQRAKPAAGRPLTPEQVRKQVREILAGQHMKELIKFEVRPQEKNPPELRFWTDQAALDELKARQLGKTILMSDNHAWAAEQILDAYRGQAKIEEVFRDMNDHDFLRWQPMFHWTDQKIRVHGFYCVLAMQLTALLKKVLHEAGIELSTHKMLKALSGIREVVIYYADNACQPKVAPLRLNPVQKKMSNLLKLDEFKLR